MKQQYLSELPEVEPRESYFSIDDLIRQCSKSDEKNMYTVEGGMVEAILSLANEVKRLQHRLDKLEK